MPNLGMSRPRSSVDKCRRWWWIRFPSTSRKFLICLFFFGMVCFYFGPYLPTLHSKKSEYYEEVLKKCIDDTIHKLYFKEGMVDQFTFFVEKDFSHTTLPNKYLPSVGNGEFLVVFEPSPTIYLKEKRTLSLDVGWDPLIQINYAEPVRHFYQTNVLKGIVNDHICVGNGLRITSTYVAHRTIPNLFYQDIVIFNPRDQDIVINFEDRYIPQLPSIQISRDSTQADFAPILFSSIVKNISQEESIALCVATKSMYSFLQIPAFKSKHITIPVILYQETVLTKAFQDSRAAGDLLQRKCDKLMENVTKKGIIKWDQDHTAAWNNLWKTGLNISQSKAEGALNNDQINATIYYVLSSVPLHKNNKDSALMLTNITNYTPILEGCYGGYHHTLQAHSLWQELNTFKGINNTVNFWLLTLEKQGCHKLLQLGAGGVVQAMVLSFGGFRFSPHHLEFKIEPKFLHRDYNFRNILLGYKSYLNVSVILQEDNKAVLAVSVSKPTNQDYWACSGGCNDEAIKLSFQASIFPVKVTEPVTSILYVTPDRTHMELIKDTLHVHKIVEAPAHDHHVVALHKHGSQLSGLPAFFWAFVGGLIFVFHLFLCKLIYQEYCGKDPRNKNKYTRVPANRGV